MLYFTLASATGSSKKPSGKASVVLAFGGCLGLGGFSLYIDSPSCGADEVLSESKKSSGTPVTGKHISTVINEAA